MMPTTVEPPACPSPDADLAASRMTVGGVSVSRISPSELCALMVSDSGLAREGRIPTPRIVTSVNGSIIALYHADVEFRRAFEQADVIDADGMSIVFASRLFCQRPLEERVATTDFLLDASRLAASQRIRFFFLGGRRGVAARAAEHLRSRFPGLEVVGTHHGYFDDTQIPALCRAIRASGADVLWLGLGSPRQEIIAATCRNLLPGVAWIRTCGGLFDHYGGGVSRAPVWMQTMGLEWLYRAAREPLRLGWRYLVTNPRALYHLITKTHD